MTIYDEVKTALEEDKFSRERVNKDATIAILLEKAYPEMKKIEFTTFLDILRKYSSYDRAWRKVTRDNVELRGNDYNQKVRLEENKLQELGYK